MKHPPRLPDSSPVPQIRLRTGHNPARGPALAMRVQVLAEDPFTMFIAPYTTADAHEDSTLKSPSLIETALQTCQG